MPVGTQNYPFGGGADGNNSYGDRWVVCFSGTWAFGDLWTVKLVSTQGDYTLGVGYFAGLTPTVCMTYRDRVYLGMQSQVNFSDNGDPTGWEIQNAGAGFLTYLSQFGGQDTVEALAQLQGRLVILATNSCQIWIVDADPSQFSLQQTLDNFGTESPLSVWSIGDLDVIFLDTTGFRSLRAREVTLNAYVDDIGTPVDNLVRADLLVVGADTGVGTVEPTTKNYWCYLNGKIYVLARFLASKITAWSQYLPTYLGTFSLIGTSTIFTGSPPNGIITITTLTVGVTYKLTLGNAVSFIAAGITYTTDGYFTATAESGVLVGPVTVAWTGTFKSQTTFTPQKFVNYLKRTYCRSVENLLLLYGGSTNNVYDNSVVTIETPYLDDKTPASSKQGQGINFAIAGAWTISVGVDPPSGTLTTVIAVGNGSNPAENSDSSYDIGRIAYEAIGTHFKMRSVSSATSERIAIVSALLYHYNKANIL